MAILTPDQKLRVFISSTLAELAPERVAACAAVEELHLTPVMFELGARPHPPQALYRAYLEQSHVFVGIYWQRYGWVAPTMDISGLEDEYRLAGARPRLIYLKEPAPEREEELSRLLRAIQGDDLASYRRFTDADELRSLLADDLAVMLTEGFVTEPASGATTSSQRRSTLPVPATPLVGRENEVGSALRLLQQPGVRLVTLTGTGGIGKTRLALEIARRVEEKAWRAVIWISLATVPDDRMAPSKVAESLGIQLDSSRGPVGSIAAALADAEPMLVVLDNAEHLPGFGAFLAELLAACSALQVLVTSQRRTRLAAEHVLEVLPLETPRDPSGPQDAAAAVQLFVQRARQVNSAFAASDPQDLAAVVEICRRLEGLPLAIELAASRVRLLGPRALLARLGDGLSLPPSSLPEAPARQRTMRAALDWSVGQLGPEAKSLLAQFSTFAGGATLAAVERVCEYPGDMLEGLGELIDHSLMRVQALDPENPRFTVLEPVRLYARELLEQSGRADDVDRRQMEWFLELGHEAAAGLAGADQDQWSQRLAQEMANFLAAGERVVRFNAAAGMAQLTMDIYVWTIRYTYGAEQMLGWLQRALAMEAATAPLVRARILWAIGGTHFTIGEFDRAGAEIEEAHRLFAESGDLTGQALCLLVLGSTAPFRGDFEGAAALLAEAADLGAAAEEPFVEVSSLGHLSAVLASLGRLDEAEAVLARARGRLGSVSGSWIEAHQHVYEGIVHLLRGREVEARAALLAAARAAWAAQSWDLMANTCDGFGTLLLLRGEYRGAATVLSAAQQLRQRAGIALWPDLLDHLHRAQEQCRSALSEEDYNRAEAAGRVQNVQQAYDLVVGQGAS